MTNNSIRNFAAGLLVATSVCGAAYYFSPTESTSTLTGKQPSVAEMKSVLTDKGYIIHTEAEWNDQLASIKAKNGNAKQVPQEKVVYRTILTVSRGMTSIDVGKALQKTKIIKNGSVFSKEVEKRKLESDLRPGTFKVESGMTMDELIQVIFKK